MTEPVNQARNLLCDLMPLCGQAVDGHLWREFQERYALLTGDVAGASTIHSPTVMLAAVEDWLDETVG
ncbi:MAG: hypothetical protein M0R06_15310 [Sphaerochaeta sp.]|jgi:hypothetical protein|nr:hypothetical protein [Sphaerochaeta sp.]